MIIYSLMSLKVLEGIELVDLNWFWRSTTITNFNDCRNIIFDLNFDKNDDRSS